MHEHEQERRNARGALAYGGGRCLSVVPVEEECAGVGDWLPCAPLPPPGLASRNRPALVSVQLAKRRRVGGHRGPLPHLRAYP